MLQSAAGPDGRAQAPAYGSSMFESARPVGAERSCRAVAYAATLAQLCLGAAPLVLALQLGHDPDAAFWVGRAGCWAPAAPAFVLLLHFVHLRLIRMNRQDVGIFMAMGLPALALAFVGGWYAARAHFVRSALLAEGCAEEGLPRVQELEHVYQGTQALWMRCLARVLTENGGVPPLRRPTLPACLEWTSAVDRLPPDNLAAVRYLATVEATHSCGGFCQGGPALFSSTDEVPSLRGACLQPITAKLRAVRREGAQLLGASLAEIVAMVAVLVAAQPLLLRLGYGRSRKAALPRESAF